MTLFCFIYLLITCLFFLIWNFLCSFKKISSLVSHFFSTIFSFFKLVFNFWQIARLQEFFSLHIVEDYYMMPSMDGWRDRWMESLNFVPNAEVCVYLMVHITKLQLQTTFPKPLYIPHSACIHRDPSRWKSWCLHYLWPVRYQHTADHGKRPEMANIPQRCSVFNLDSWWLSLQMPFEQEIDDDAKQMANQSRTWWCGVWTHICQHCSLWWSLLQWHVDLISWQSTSYHCIILLIDWDCTTKGLARPLWVPTYDLRYR
jgi:hypothetical protein